MQLCIYVYQLGQQMIQEFTFKINPYFGEKNKIV